jgi:PmbA protein
VTDLLDIARRVAGAARPDEQVEAYVVRSRETDVEVFGGEVESLTTAVIEGIGIRVIADHRQGYAWAGSLDASVIDETLRDARDNASFGEADEWYALAGPADANGVRAPVLDLWRDELAAVLTDEKVKIALDLDNATRAADPRIRNVEATGYGDSLTEAAIANSLGVESAQRRTTCSASSSAIADDGTGAQTGYGFVAGRQLSDLDLDSVPIDAATRACRLLGARPIAGP